MITKSQNSIKLTKLSQLATQRCKPARLPKIRRVGNPKRDKHLFIAKSVAKQPKKSRSPIEAVLVALISIFILGTLLYIFSPQEDHSLRNKQEYPVADTLN